MNYIYNFFNLCSLTISFKNNPLNFIETRKQPFTIIIQLINQTHTYFSRDIAVYQASILLCNIFLPRIGNLGSRFQDWFCQHSLFQHNQHCHCEQYPFQHSPYLHCPFHHNRFLHSPFLLNSHCQQYFCLLNHLLKDSNNFKNNFLKNLVSQKCDLVS